MEFSMPKLTMWKPTKTKDYYFIDNQVRQQYEVGGIGMIVHKFLGPQVLPVEDSDPSLPNYVADGSVNETKIQDLLNLETRDRTYDQDVYIINGAYNVGDNDFDLSQFGLFLTNDMLFVTCHLNSMVDILGRKLMNGDVIELPHLIDDLGLDADAPPIPKFYVVQDASRASEGFSPTWWPHIWRIKLGPLTDTQEYSSILGSNDDPNSLASRISTYNKVMDISDATVLAAELNNPNNERLIDHLFGVEVDNTDSTYDGLPAGDSFPLDANDGDYFVRTDFTPNRIFVKQGTRWQNVYDGAGDKTWVNKTFNGAEFVNNTGTTVTDGGNSEFPERQPLSKANMPRK